MKRKQALEGIKVVDFTWSVAGGAIGQCLAQFGAQVIKVESSTRLDITRANAPYKDKIASPDHAGMFPVIGCNKHSLTLDLEKPRAIEIAKRLVAWGDVVLESFRPGVMKKLGINYEELNKVKPDVIMLSSSLMGQTGPLATLAAWGNQIGGITGLYHVTGFPDGEPTATPVVYPDLVTPWFGIALVLGALDYRRKTGKGQYIDLSEMETTIHSLVPALLEYAVNGSDRGRIGNRSSHACPHSAFRCKGDDRWCVIAVFTDEEWQTACEIMGNHSWAKEARFATFVDRKANEDELEKLIESWTTEHTAEEVMKSMQARGITAGVVESMEDVMDKDPQFRHRHFFWKLDHPMMGLCTHMGHPVKLSKTPYKVRRVPLLGEHNEYVCTEILGMSQEEFAELLESEVLK